MMMGEKLEGGFEVRLLRDLALLLVSLSTIGVSVLSGAFLAPAEAASKRQAWQKWLESEYEKVRQDSAQLLELAHKLAGEAHKHQGNPIEPAWLTEVDELERRAEELRKAVEQVDEKFLSLPVLEQAETIEKQSRELGRAWERSREAKRLKRLRELAREMEKKAEGIADRMRQP
jgi:hypothetical protein